MAQKLFGLEPEAFVWATGIEDTFIPQSGRVDERALDEYELTGHYKSWREDVDLAADLGVKAMRYGVPWYRIEASPGRFEWDWMDQVLQHAADSGIAVIADLVHFGTPAWLDHQFADADYPQRVAEYAAEFAHRYKGLVSHYTPQNSPSVTALLCGDLGIWPPYLQGEEGAVRLIRLMARGMALTVEAIREADQEATIVSVDGALEFLPARLDGLGGVDGSAAEEATSGSLDRSEIATSEVHAAATILSQRTFMGSDLVSGAVDASHPLADWLARHGMTDAELAWHQDHAATIDVFGLNYYPQFTAQSLGGQDGQLVPQRKWGGVAGLERAVRAFATRYGKPVMISETDVNGTIEQRSDWLRTSIEAIPRLRASGLPLVGYTWWPLFALVDWAYRTGGPRFFDPDGSEEVPRPWSVESYLDPMGLYDLEPTADGTLERVRTPLVDRYAAAIRDGEDLLRPSEPVSP